MEVRFNPAFFTPYAAFIAAAMTKQSAQFNFVFDGSVSGQPQLHVSTSNGQQLLVTGSFSIAHLLASSSQTLLTGISQKTASKMDEQELRAAAANVLQYVEMALSELKATTLEQLDLPLQKLDHVLLDKTHLSGNHLSLADLIVYEILKVNKLWKGYQAKFGGNVSNLCRWFSYMESMPLVHKCVQQMAAIIKKKGSSHDSSAQLKDRQQKKREVEGGFNIDLPNAEMDKVVTRFPPEPSGYLHIGHAKAALLNYYFARKYNGRMLMRFDDTNPAKEKAEYEQGIIDDLNRLEIKHSGKITYTSDYFDYIEECCEKLIKERKAYVDDTPVEQFRMEKMEGIDSKNREQSTERNLELWEEMKKGTAKGRECAVRAKIDMQSENKTLRDPVMYRCKLEAHPRTGTKYNVYPTYDFSCPIVDVIEGVTHTLRTSEYNDRNDQYYWFCDALGMRRPHIWDYSRMNFFYTVMSKRRLTRLVDEGLVEGWDDPRFPTVRGLVRRGLTVEGLTLFVLSQGASRNIATMEFEKLWAFNKKVLDPIVPRYTALNKEGITVLHLEDGPTEVEIRENPKHKKNPSLGTKTVRYFKDVHIDAEDANAIEENEEVTLMDWGNAIVQKIVRDKDGKVTEMFGKLNLSGNVKTTKKKLTWLAAVDKDNIDVKVVYFGHLLKKKKLEDGDDFQSSVNHESRHESISVADSYLKTLKKGEHIQLERRGYFIVDVPAKEDGTGMVLFNIPDGRKMD